MRNSATITCIMPDDDFSKVREAFVKADLMIYMVGAMTPIGEKYVCQAVTSYLPLSQYEIGQRIEKAKSINADRLTPYPVTFIHEQFPDRLVVDDALVDDVLQKMCDIADECGHDIFSVIATTDMLLSEYEETHSEDDAKIMDSIVWGTMASDAVGRAAEFGKSLIDITDSVTIIREALKYQSVEDICYAASRKFDRTVTKDDKSDISKFLVGQACCIKTASDGIADSGDVGDPDVKEEEDQHRPVEIEPDVQACEKPEELPAASSNGTIAISDISETGNYIGRGFMTLVNRIYDDDSKDRRYIANCMQHVAHRVNCTLGEYIIENSTHWVNIFITINGVKNIDMVIQNIGALSQPETGKKFCLFVKHILSSHGIIAMTEISEGSGEIRKIAVNGCDLSNIPKLKFTVMIDQLMAIRPLAETITVTPFGRQYIWEKSLAGERRGACYQYYDGGKTMTTVLEGKKILGSSNRRDHTIVVWYDSSDIQKALAMALMVAATAPVFKSIHIKSNFLTVVTFVVDDVELCKSVYKTLDNLVASIAVPTDEVFGYAANSQMYLWFKCPDKLMHIGEGWKSLAISDRNTKTTVTLTLVSDGIEYSVRSADDSLEYLNGKFTSILDAVEFLTK